MHNRVIVYIDYLGLMDARDCDSKLIPSLMSILRELESIAYDVGFLKTWSNDSRIMFEVGALNEDLNFLSNGTLDGTMDDLADKITGLLKIPPMVNNKQADSIVAAIIQEVTKGMVSDGLKNMIDEARGSGGKCGSEAKRFAKSLALSYEANLMKTKLNNFFNRIKDKCPCASSDFSDRIKEMQDRWDQNSTVSKNNLDGAKLNYEKCLQQ